MSELKRIDQLIAHLRGQLARGRMSYDETVTTDDLISILDEIRLKVVEDIGTGRISPSPETPLDTFLRIGRAADRQR